MMITNTLQVTPDLFKIFRTHAQALRRDVNAMLAQEDARLKAQEAAFAAGGADAVKALEKAGGAGGGAGAGGSDDGSDGAGECVCVCVFASLMHAGSCAGLCNLQASVSLDGSSACDSSTLTCLAPSPT